MFGLIISDEGIKKKGFGIQQYITAYSQLLNSALLLLRDEILCDC